MIEILVVMAIFSILLALLLPAMMSARGAAQRTQCTNNLKQIGLAITNYETQWNQYPNGLSFKYSLLPYLERNDVYESHGPPGSFYEPIEDVVIATYYCPSDWAPARVVGSGRANYAGCFGSGALTDGLNGIFLVWSRTSSPPAIPISSASVEDGLSNTAAVSEILCSVNDQNAVLRVQWNTPRQYLPTEADAFAQFCDGIPPSPASRGYVGIPFHRGVPWYDGNYGHGLYNHVLTPNRPSCLNQTNLRTGISTASSLHSGGANVLLADGHVRFVSNAIDQATWRELGSRVSKAATFP